MALTASGPDAGKHSAHLSTGPDSALPEPADSLTSMPDALTTLTRPSAESTTKSGAPRTTSDARATRSGAPRTTSDARATNSVLPTSTSDVRLAHDAFVSAAPAVGAVEDRALGAQGVRSVARDETALPRQVLAKIGDREISSLDVARAADTFEHRAAQAALLATFGRALGIEAKTDEARDAYAARVFDEARKQDRLALFEGILTRELEASLKLALTDLTTLALLDKMLEAATGPMPPDEDESLSARIERRRVRLQEVLAQATGGQASPAEMNQALDMVLDHAFEEALCAPHQAKFDAMFPGWTPEMRIAARAALLSLYVPSHDILAATALAHDLDIGGPAAEASKFFRILGRSDLSVGDLDAAGTYEGGELRETAQRLLARADVPDPVADGLTPIHFELEDGKLSAKVGEPVHAKVLDAVREGRVHCHAKASQQGLYFEADPGVSVSETDIKQAQAVVSARFSIAAKALFDELAGRSRSRIDELLRPLLPFLGAKTKSLFFESPEASRGLEEATVRAAVRQEPVGKLQEAFGRVGVPAERRQSLIDLLHRVRLLDRMHPIPAAVRDVLLSGDAKEVTISLLPGKTLDASERSTLALLQRMLVLNGLLSPSVSYGSVDDATATQLAQLQPDGEGLFRVDSASFRALMGTTARLMNVDDEILGGLILRNPVFQVHRARGGRANPVRLMQAYLAEKGVDLGPADSEFPARFAEALHFATEAGVDRAALRAAERDIERWHREALDGGAPKVGPRRPSIASGTGVQVLPLTPENIGGILGARVLISKEPLAFYSPGLERSVPAKINTLTRLIPYALPSASRSLKPSLNPLKRGLSDVTLYDPTVALKLLLSRFRETKPPINAEGVISRHLGEQDVLDLRDLRFGRMTGEQAENQAYARWTRVAEYIRDGRVVLADLAHDVPSSTDVGRDVNFVLGELRHVVAAVRANAAPFVRPDAAVRAHGRKNDPLLAFRDPLLKAKEIVVDALKLSSSSGAGRPRSGAQLEASDVKAISNLRATIAARYRDALSRHEELRLSTALTAKRFLDRFELDAPLLDRVDEAIRGGRLRVAEHSIRSTPRDAELELAAERVKQLFIMGAEVFQTERREKARGGVARLERAAISATHHLFLLPNFGDDGVLFNAFDDWALLALKLEMNEKGLKQDLSVKAPGTDSPDPERVSRLSSVGPQIIRYVLAHYPDFIGRSTLQTLTTGMPSKLPGEKKSRALLLRVAEEMEAGRLAPWDSPNVTARRSGMNPKCKLTESENDQARLIFQAALRDLPGNKNLFRSAIGGRDAASAKELVTRLVGLDGTELAPFLRSFALQKGLIDADKMGPIRESRIHGPLLEAAASIADDTAKAYRSDSPELATELDRAGKLLRAAARSGKVVDLGREIQTTSEGKALRTILFQAVMGLGSTHQMEFLDFDEILGHAPANLRVDGPLENVVATKPLFSSFDEVFAAAGHRIPWRDTGWATRAKNFSPTRVWQTSIASYVLFQHMMSTLIGYDLWVSPAVQSAKALVKGHVAETPLEREEAHGDLETTWRRWLDLLAMFTAFSSPTGFGLDIGYELQRGNLDVALGKSVPYLPFMWMAGAGMAHAARQQWTRRRPYSVVEMAGYTAEPAEQVARGVLEASAPEASAVRRWAAGAFRRTGAAVDAVLEPGSLFLRPVAGMREAARRAGPTRYVNLGAAPNDVAGAGALDEHILSFIRGVAHRNGAPGVLEVTLQSGGKEFPPVRVGVQAFIDLANCRDGKIPVELAERLGMVGAHRKTMLRALYDEAQKLPAELRVRRVPFRRPDISLRALAEDAGAVTEWAFGGMEHLGVDRIPIRNSELLHGIRAHFENPATLEAQLPANLKRYATLIADIAEHFRDVPLSEVRGFARQARVLDAASQLRWIGRGGGALLSPTKAAVLGIATTWVATRMVLKHRDKAKQAKQAKPTRARKPTKTTKPTKATKPTQATKAQAEPNAEPNAGEAKAFVARTRTLPTSAALPAAQALSTTSVGAREGVDDARAANVGPRVAGPKTDDAVS
ncbi:MAG: hypothetical protein IPK13_22100 [Deltaproteobacteria bacterium]|nr:hypothetical protein [Deltaproteobacteria bacterium]